MTAKTTFIHRPVSLTLRVVLFVMAAIGLSMVLNAILVLRSINHHFVAQDADELRVITRSIEQVLLQPGKDGENIQDALSHAVAGHHGVYYQVKDSSGQLVFRSEGSDFSQTAINYTPPDHINADSLSVWRNASGSYRGVMTKFSSGPNEYQVKAAINMDFHEQFLRKFRESLWLIMLATGVITLLATWFGIYQGHLPLRGLSNRFREIQANRLDVRIDPDTVPVELRELVGSFNHMISRLEQGFERLSHFSSDIAHELRTPLTNLITQTQVTLGQSREVDVYRESLYSNLEEMERLSKMVGDMLWLAKSENDLIKPVLTPLDMVREFQELFDFFGALAAEEEVSFSLEGQVPLVCADRELLRRAISNLLSNAIRYTKKGETIKVRLAALEHGLVSVSICNPGPEIPAQHLPKLFDRFYRVDPSRQRQSQGAGLGLAITKSIIESHGGRLAVKSADGSTVFSFTLPLSDF